MASFVFDATTVEPKTEFSPIPAGTYTAVIEHSEVNPTKSGTGQVITFRWRIIDGQYINRTVFDRVNPKNDNETAQKIGQAILSQLCRLVGIDRFSDTSQLHNKPVNIKVAIRTSEGYPDQNVIKGYAKADNVSVPTGGAAGSPVPPWMKK